MQNLNLASTPECWGKSELLKKLLLAGKMGNLEVVPRKRAKGKQGWAPFTDEECEHNLWARVEIKDNGCWEFTGCRVGKYRQARYRCGREQIASRVAWVFTREEIPLGQCVLHRCDNEACVRPDHLFLGTRTDNNFDKLTKGRQWRPIGNLNWAAKLDESRVRKIRAMKKPGISDLEISKEIGCSRMAVNSVVNGRTWTHVT